jgi:hypothetical protein
MATILKFNNAEVGFPPDPMLSNGSLMLYDMSVLGLAAVPGQLQKLKNQAWAKAQALIPGSIEEELKPIFYSSFDAPSGLAEISNKKGLHIIASQVGGNAAKGAVISEPDKIRKYLYENPTHKIYQSIWQRFTRVSTYNDASNCYIGETNSAYHSILKFNTRAPSAGENLIGFFDSTTNPRTATNVFRAIATNAFTGVPSASAPNGNQRSGVYWGSFSAGASAIPSDVFRSLVLNAAPSFILYRRYIEDLTVSGRTFAEVQAQDKALFDAAFTVGGAFYGDTFTAASVLP